MEDHQNSHENAIPIDKNIIKTWWYPMRGKNVARDIFTRELEPPQRDALKGVEGRVRFDLREGCEAFDRRERLGSMGPIGGKGVWHSSF